VAAGNPGAAAVAMDEKALLDGMQQRTVTALQQLYVTIPGGGCAVTNRGGIPALEPACPKLREDMCAAAADLQQAFVWARWPQKARPMAETAVSRYGCSAALLDTAR